MASSPMEGTAANNLVTCMKRKNKSVVSQDLLQKNIDPNPWQRGAQGEARREGSDVLAWKEGGKTKGGRVNE